MASENKPTKWHRIAVEGATTDGRTILREWLTGAAAAYNTDVYGARINCEHIRGYAPMVDPKTNPFGAYGDITALKAEEIADGPLKGKMGLYAQLKPTDELVALNRKAQKVYSSIELDPEFANTGTPYLLGMAVTDNPASLGTSYLQFCASNPASSPLAARHTTETALFTAAEEITLAFTRENADPQEQESGSHFFTKISAQLFAGSRRQTRDTTDLQNAVELMANSQRDALDDIDALKQSAKDLAQLKQDFSQLKQSHDDLKTQLESQPQHFTPRPPATGATSTDTTVDY